MANLSVSDRTKIWRGVMRYWSHILDSVSATKFELYNPSNDTGMIADVDTWVDTHGGNTAPDTVGANGAINASYRNKFTTAQKAIVLMAIAAMRTGQESILQGALGQDVN